MTNDIMSQYVLWLLRSVQPRLVTVTKWRLRYVILRFVAVPDLPLFPVCLSCFVPQGFFLWDKQKTDAYITGKVTSSFHPRHPGPERVFHLTNIFRGQTSEKIDCYPQLQCQMAGNVVVFLTLEKKLDWNRFSGYIQKKVHLSPNVKCISITFPASNKRCTLKRR